MKKHLFTVAALGLMMSAGCVRNDVSEGKIPASNTIQFNLLATRAGVTETTTLENDPVGFRVFATSNNEPNAWFDGLNGTKNYLYTGGQWGWDGTPATWPVLGASYPMYFYAWYPDLAAPTLTVTSGPGGSGVSSGVTTLAFDYAVPATAATQHDLVVGTANVPTTKPSTGTLDITFNHILSRVNFKINAEMGYKAYIQQLEVKNVAGGGTYDVVATTNNWDNNDTWDTDYVYFDRAVDGAGSAKLFTGDDTPQAFYSGGDAIKNYLMLVPQDPTLNNWNPLSAITAPTNETYIELIYRLVDNTNADLVGITGHATEGDLFVKVAFPYTSEWEEGKGYTYTIAMPGTTGGYLIDQKYYKADGTPSSVDVDFPLLPGPVFSTPEEIILVPTVHANGWGDENIKIVDPATLTGITLNKTTTTINVDESEQLSVTGVQPVTALLPGITWSSSDTTVATVDPATGEVTIDPDALSNTDVTITATANDGSGVTASCTVTVGGVSINNIVWATCNVDAPGTFAALPESPGLLYQWGKNTGWPLETATVTWPAAMSNAVPWEAINDPCPAGWRVPSASELENLVPSGSVTCARVMVNGSTVHQVMEVASGRYISLREAGRILDGGSYGGGSYSAEYWSSANFGDKHLYFESSGVREMRSTRGLGCALSVRCVRN